MSDLTEYLHEKYSVLFSTDIVGFFGNPLTAIEFLKIVCSDEINFGLEAVAFNHSINNLNGTSGLIGGFHGKIGLTPSNTRAPFDHIKVAFLDRQIVGTQNLLRLASSFNRPIYVNVHNHELSLQSDGQVVNGQATLVVENDISPESVVHALELSQKKGINRIYDLVHGGKARPNFDWNNNWHTILDELIEFKPCLVHIPIGTDASDSLPNGIPNEFWSELGKTMKELKAFPVVECQWGITMGSVFCNPSNDKWRIKYLQQKLRILVNSKIIK
ncbi:MAG: hypothetical protein Q8L51_01555 [Candidatus Amesbacteria bacterium]|nr:hypothetical protein [Candidatus Amesbacteria bacterium]